MAADLSLTTDLILDTQTDLGATLVVSPVPELNPRTLFFNLGGVASPRPSTGIMFPRAVD